MDNAVYPIESASIPVVAGRWPVLSLFSGAGGLDQGFMQAGFEPVLAIDINPAAVATYARNHPSTKTTCMDLATTDPATILNQYQGGMCISGVLKTAERTTRHLISPLGPNWVGTDIAV